ncbi:MAG: hypothetical protein ACRDG8_09620 [Actinomycetota bacterium]
MRARMIVGVLLLVGCTAGIDGPTRPAGPAILDVVALGSEMGSMIVDARTGAVLAADAGEIPSPDGSRLYATASAAGLTTLRTRDTASGEVLSARTIDGRLEARVASTTGSAVALMSPLPEGLDPSDAIPRSRTTIVVVDPTGDAAPRRYRLTGNFEPEAFSVDDSRLFLIQYLPAEAPSVYRVTYLDLREGGVHAVFGRFKSPPERMPGVRLSQVFDPASEQLYTLYTNRKAAHFHDHWQTESYGGNEVSFVHVLNLRDGWAFCAGLPRVLWGQPASAQAMAPSPDGTQLYVVDSVRGRIAQLDTRSMRIVRRATIDLGSGEGGRTAAVMSPEGGTLFVTSARNDAVVYGIDVGSFTVRDRWSIGEAVAELGLSDDGGRLYAALPDAIAIVDTDTGDPLGELDVGHIESIVHIATPSR